MPIPTPDSFDAARLRADLTAGYNPVNEQELHMVRDVVDAWTRLQKARRREDLLFELQAHAEKIKQGFSEYPLDRERMDALVFLEKGHKGYDQILRAIRDSERAYDQAIRRIEQTQDRRLRRERLDRRAPAKAHTPHTHPANAAHNTGRYSHVDRPDLCAAPIQSR